MSHFLYPVVSWQIIQLASYLSCCELNCYKHEDICNSFTFWFHFVFVNSQEWDGWIIWSSHFAICKEFSLPHIIVVLVYILTNSVLRYFTVSPPALVIFWFLDNSHSNLGEVKPHGGFACISLMHSVPEYLFMYLLIICISSFKICRFTNPHLSLVFQLFWLPVHRAQEV